MPRRRGQLIPFPRRPTPAEPPVSERRLVELRRCDQAEAVVLKSLLESHGIAAFLRSRLAHSVHPFTVGAQGEVVVMVQPPDAVRARGLLLRVVNGAR
jgi:hypothetical protein